LGAVKNVGESAIEAIIEGRKDGPFRDLFDFCERVDLRRVKKRVVESLIKCGAFDSTGAGRSSLIAGIEDAVAFGQKIQQERESAQVSLFGTAELVKSNGNGRGKLAELPEWDEKLLLAFEKEALGFFITGHPLQRYAADMKRFATTTTASLADLADKSEVKICGIVAGLKEIITKKGERMGFVTLEDLSGSVEVVVFSDVYAVAVEYLKGEDPLLVTGAIDVGEKNTKIMAATIFPPKEVNERETTVVSFNLTAHGLEKGQLESLKEVIARYPGACRAVLNILIPGRSITAINLPESCTVAASEELMVEVKNLFGYNAVSFE